MLDTNKDTFSYLIPDNYLNNVKSLIKFNDKLYEILEEDFLVKNSDNVGKKKMFDLYNNISELRNSFDDDELLENKDTFFENVEILLNSNKSIFEYFKQVDEKINEYNEILLTKIFGDSILISKHLKIHHLNNKDNPNVVISKRNKKMPQVFLSYAFADRLLSLCLYILFYENGIFLYVDWLCNEAFSDGKIIKEILSKELKKSSQFLFLQTISSQLRIKGNTMIRGWCSWEMGTFYNVKSKDEKYSIKFYSTTKKYPDSLQMDGFKQFHGINIIEKKIF